MDADIRKCPCPSCDADIPVNTAMCAPHWKLVPEDTKDAIFALNRHAHGPGSTQGARDAQQALIVAAAEALDTGQPAPGHR